MGKNKILKAIIDPDISIKIALPLLGVGVAAYGISKLSLPGIPKLPETIFTPEGHIDLNPEREWAQRFWESFFDRLRASIDPSSETSGTGFGGGGAGVRNGYRTPVLDNSNEEPAYSIYFAQEYGVAKWYIEDLTSGRSWGPYGTYEEAAEKKENLEAGS